MPASAAEQTIAPTAFQARVLATPEDHDLAAVGGRGGGKTFAVLLAILRHVEAYGHDARVLVVRRNFPDLRDFEAEARLLFTTAYGQALSYNAQSHLFTFPSGATVQLEQYEGIGNFAKLQGKSFSLICVEEAGQYADPAPLDMLRSCLRSKAGVPCRMILTANPGGPGHGWINDRHVAATTPWLPYVEPKSGRPFITVPSTLADNDHLGSEYEAQIRAATSSDPELQKAWLFGDWRIARGAYFSSVFDSSRNVITPWQAKPHGWELYLAGDHGASAPCVFYLCARSPGDEGPDGRYYPADSVVLFDEVAFVEQNSINKGLGLTIPTMAEEVVEVCKTWGMLPRGVMDDATFSQNGSAGGSLADEYRRAGLHVHRAQKGDRISGWERMRRMLADAGKTDAPGLYISERCAYLLRTLPYLERNPRRPEDVDSTGPDHGADACRYSLLYQAPRMHVRRVRGF